MTILALGFFTSFLLFAFLGGLTLLVATALEKSIGKEIALVLWAAVLVGVAWLIRPVAPPTLTPRPATLALRAAVDPSQRVVVSSQVFDRLALPRGVRNAFQEQSDTRPLPPEPLAEPPAIALAFPRPPTVPGVAPARRHRYRGTLPQGKAGDGSKLPDVPVDAFTAWRPEPKDVFDWIIDGGKPYYIVLKEIDGVHEGTPEFDAPSSPKWNLVTNGGPPAFEKPWSSLRVVMAVVGTEEAAKALVATPRKAALVRVSSLQADERERWFLKRTVDNLFIEACRKQGNPRVAALSVESLLVVAAEMADVGAKGKEDGKGWTRAIAALETALAKCKEQSRNPSDVLRALIDAYHAVHDETREMETLAAFNRSAKTSLATAEGLSFVGDLWAHRLRLPDRALVYYGDALAAQSGFRAALIGRGDALSAIGDHAGALRSYKDAGSPGRGELAVREGEAHLRLGDLAAAKDAAATALGSNAYDVEALLVKGSAQYAGGDFAGARETFAQASVLPGEGTAGTAARRHRAEALYDLGLAELALGHVDAAIAAFDAAEKALRAGASRGRTPDETVSPELGRALVHVAQGNLDEAAAALDRAREQAAGVTYVEFLAGVVARMQGDAPRARARFEAALALAPGMHELDGWLADARLAVGKGAIGEGKSAAEASPDFEAAILFARRAAVVEAATDPKNADFAIREALAQTQPQHVSERKRFADAEKTVAAVIAKVPDERRALAVKGYCDYRLGEYAQCQRDFQASLKVPSAPDDPYRLYAAACLKIVTRWLLLEEKLVEFSENKLSSEWETIENQGIRVGSDEGWLVFRDVNKSNGASQTGTEADPTVVARAKKLFGKDTLESVQAWVQVPRTGAAVPQVTFGVVVQPASSGGKGLAKNQGFGIFYDEGKVAVRIGGGRETAYKDGTLKPVMKDGKPMPWPFDPTGAAVLVEIERSGDDGATIVMRLGGQEIVKDTVSSFKRGRADFELWLGGWSGPAMNWDVRVDKVRVVRTMR